MNERNPRGLPARIAVPIVVLCGVVFLGIVAYFLRIGLGVEGAALGPGAAASAAPGASQVTRVPNAAGELPGNSVGGGGPAAQNGPPPEVAAALARLRARLERNTRDADALTELAGLELQAGRFAQARDMYKRALASRPGDPLAATGEARALAGLGDAPVARALLERVLLAHPNFAPAVQAKAQLSEAAPR